MSLTDPGVTKHRQRSSEGSQHKPAIVQRGKKKSACTHKVTKKAYFAHGGTYHASIPITTVQQKQTALRPVIIWFFHRRIELYLNSLSLETISLGSQANSAIICGTLLGNLDQLRSHGASGSPPFSGNNYHNDYLVHVCSLGMHICTWVYLHMYVANTERSGTNIRHHSSATVHPFLECLIDLELIK